MARQATVLRLLRGEWPDFELRFGATIEPFEVTEADLEGRRRGREYREDAQWRAAGDNTAHDDPVEDWIARAEEVPSRLRAAAMLKVGKH